MNEQAPRRPSGRGQFITFEGGEGSGKSTQIKLLAERLASARLRAIVTREPGGSPGAEIMRHLVLSGMGKLLGPEAETLLFAAARDDHVRTVIQPGAQPGDLGAVRPLFEFDPRLSGQARQGRAGRAQRHAAGHHRRSQAGPDHHPRRARRRSACSAPRPGAAAARPIGSRRKICNSTKACATPTARSPPTIRERCVLIDADADPDTVADRVWTAVRERVVRGRRARRPRHERAQGRAGDRGQRIRARRADLFGHREAEATLLDAYRSGRIPHAWLIGGPQGIGKATLAYRMARFVLAHRRSRAPAVQRAEDACGRSG